MSNKESKSTTPQGTTKQNETTKGATIKRPESVYVKNSMIDQKVNDVKGKL